MTLTVQALLARAELDDSGFTRGLDRITQGLERYDRQAAALASRPVALALDTTDFDTALQRPLAQLQRFTDAIERVSGALPGLAVDPAAFTPGTQALERFLTASSRITELPALSTREQVAEIQALEAALADLGPTLARVDPGGVLQATAANVRQAFAQLRADLAQRLTIEVDPDAAVAGLTSVGTAADTLLAKLGLVRREAATPIQVVTAGGGAPLDLPDFSILAGQLQQAEREVERIIGPLDAVAAGMTRAGDGTLAYEAGLRRLQVQQDANAATAEHLATANDRLIAGMTASGRAADVASAGSRAWERGMANLRAQQDALTAGSAAAVAGSRRLAAGLTTIAVSQAGATGAVGQLASGLLLLGPGAPAVLGVAAGVAALGTAMNLLERHAREARKATDELLQGLQRAQQARLPAFEQMTQEIERVQQASDEAVERIVRLQRLASAQGLGGARLFPEIGQDLERLRELQDQLQQLIPLQERLRQEAERGHGDALIRQLELEVRSFGLSSAAARKLALEYDTQLDPATRKVAGAFLDTLDGLERQREAMRAAGRVGRQAGEEIADAFEEALRVIEAANRALQEDTTVRRVRVQQERQVEQLDLLPAPEVHGVAGAFDQATQGADALNDALAASAATSNRFFREAEAQAIRFQRALRDTRPEAQRLNDSIHDLTGGLDAIVGAARNVGLIGEEAARAIGDVLDLGDAIGNVIEKASAGNILGLVGAGINLVGGLFGGGESEHDRIVRENIEALNRNTAQLAVQDGGAGLLGRQQALVAEFIKLAQPKTVDGGVVIPTRQDFEKAAAAAGLTVKEFAAQIEAVTGGIRILDDKGRIVAKAFDQARIAIDQMIESITHFGTSISEQEEVLRTRDRLGLGPNAGLPPEAQDLARSREVLLGGLELDASWEARIAALDLSTAEGRAAYLEFIQTLFKMSQAGKLTVEQLGAFQSVTELLGPINTAADALDAFAENAEDAANRIGALNIPTIIRIDALRAAASRPEPPEPTGREIGDAVPGPFGTIPERISIGELGDRIFELLPTEKIGIGEFADKVFSLFPESGALGAVPGSEESRAFLERIATETPPDLLSAVETLRATIADKALPAGAASFIREHSETIERRTEIERQPTVVIHYHGDPKIYVTAQAGQSAEEIGRAVLREMERHAMNDTGTLQRAGEVLGAGG